MFVGCFLICVEMLVKAMSFCNLAEWALTCVCLLWFTAAIVGFTSFTQLTHNSPQKWQQFHPVALLLLPMTTTDVSTTPYKSIPRYYVTFAINIIAVTITMIVLPPILLFLLIWCCTCKRFRAHRIHFQQQFLWQFRLCWGSYSTPPRYKQKHILFFFPVYYILFSSKVFLIAYRSLA